MRRVLALYRSTVGMKALMALSGAVLVGYVVLHMLGNLKVFEGAGGFNAYAEFLREVGGPVVPRTGLLWGVRAVLLLALIVHVHAAWALARRSREARDVGYAEEESLVFSFASRTMRWGGVALLAFVVYHLLHLTTGQAHPDFVPGDVHHNVLSAFANPLVTGIYLIAMVALGLHLYHGIWSAFQTLGLNHPRYNHFRRPLAAVVALMVSVGFATVPLAILLGLIS